MTRCKTLNKIYKILGKKIKNKSITFLGVTFKANTDDMREAPSLKMIPALIKKSFLKNVALWKFEAIFKHAQKQVEIFRVFTNIWTTLYKTYI